MRSAHGAPVASAEPAAQPLELAAADPWSRGPSCLCCTQRSTPTAWKSCWGPIRPELHAVLRVWFLIVSSLIAGCLLTRRIRLPRSEHDITSSVRWCGPADADKMRFWFETTGAGDRDSGPANTEDGSPTGSPCALTFGSVLLCRPCGVQWLLLQRDLGR
jgi:hypothetical protein